MLNYVWNKKRKKQGGFTLIELVVVLAILGILIALAVPRYLGARRSALISEGDNTLQELKTLAWAYYQQYSTWAGVTAANFQGTFGFSAPAGRCWDYTMAADGTAANIQLRATGNPAGSPAKCTALGAAAAASITLQVNNDGSSARTQVLP